MSKDITTIPLMAPVIDCSNLVIYPRRRKNKDTPFCPDSEKLIKVVRRINYGVNYARGGKRIYLKFLRGKYQGSIVYISDIIKYDNRNVSKSYIKSPRYFFSLTVRYAWDDKKGKKVELLKGINTPLVEWLVNYDGPTVYKEFDTKSSVDEILAKNPLFDVRGKPIEIGNKVMFINSRFNKAASLDYGVIKEIKVKIDINDFHVDSDKNEIIVIIESVRTDKNNKPFLSNIKAYSSMIICIDDTDLVNDMLMAKLEG